MFCVLCGGSNPTGSINCQHCGKELFAPSPGLQSGPEVAESTPGKSLGTTMIQGLVQSPKAGLNTKQLIVLWYGSIVIVGIALTSGSTVGALVAAIVATVLLVYTF